MPLVKTLTVLRAQKRPQEVIQRRSHTFLEERTTKGTLGAQQMDAPMNAHAMQRHKHLGGGTRRSHQKTETGGQIDLTDNMEGHTTVEWCVKEDASSGCRARDMAADPGSSL